MSSVPSPTHELSQHQAHVYCRQEFNDAWQRVTLATNLLELSQQSRHQSDAQTSFTLRQTPLCEAAQLCYFSAEHNVRDAFPPQETVDLLDSIAQKVLDASARTVMHGAFSQGLLRAFLDCHPRIIVMTPCPLYYTRPVLHVGAKSACHRPYSPRL